MDIKEICIHGSSYKIVKKTSHINNLCSEECCFCKNKRCAAPTIKFVGICPAEILFGKVGYCFNKIN